ncbi:hypothetical protein [Saccharothrix obliqua]|uniref:hypothetical protein n=1 Tax=Saccharothrix obliqua TaxID=2861747 RepID=UPI001C5E4A66|nr:hypothetical protein [Saccharothrix obliqua]MBW4717123.1 hypothetical protein [Saccharothrix obliqua]
MSGGAAESLVRARLAAVRRSFENALAAPGDNAVPALDVDLRVDQVRQVVSSYGGPEFWEERAGLRCLANREIPQRLFLGFVVGRKRELPADLAVVLLAELCRDRPRRAVVEMDAANLVNLLVVAPFHAPGLELPIWLTLAHDLATGDDRRDVFHRLPSTRTAYDPLHAEIPPGAPYGDDLRPPREPPPTAAAYRSALLAATGPDPDAYVRAHVFERVAALLA